MPVRMVLSNFKCYYLSTNLPQEQGIGLNTSYRPLEDLLLSKYSSWSARRELQVTGCRLQVTSYRSQVTDYK